MTTGKGLAIRREQSIALTPDEVVGNASHQAKLLMDIVTKTKCFQVISGKKYLQVEAWETIGAFNRVHAITESITPIERDTIVVGYDAKVNLFNQDGLIVGGAIMSCYFTENACKGKVGDAKDKACKSAAQTFATSKAYRMNYSYIAILAGYQPTPAEEMTGEAPDERPANLEHWCEKHQTKYFKRGKMPGYAHKIEGTDEWCNEPGPPPDAPESTTSLAENKTDAVAPTVGEQPPKSNIDIDWLKENQGKAKFPDKTAISWLKSKINYQGLDFSGTLIDIVSRMNKEQKDFLFKEIQDRVGMA